MSAKSFAEFSLEQLECKDGYGSVDGPFGSNLPAHAYTDSGVPIVRGVNLSLGEERFKDYGYKFISEAFAEKLKRSSCKPNDIVFTKKGTLGQTGLVPSDSEYNYFILSSNQMRVRLNETIANPLYVYYFVSCKQSRDRVLADAMTSGVPKINLTYLRKFKVLLPDISTQKKIAAILSAYDDLIENNKRRIALLEKMAEEIYREWFVRFRFPGYQDAEFEKGIPKGWGIKKLSDVCELLYGKALKQEEREDGPFPVYGSSGVVGYHKKALTKSGGIIVGRKGNVGSIHWCDVPFFPIDTVYYVKSDLSMHYVFYLLGSMNFINNDAAVPGLNRNQAYSNLLLMPGLDLIELFEVHVKPLFEQKRILAEQITNLETTKSLLLPRLISGKLSVEDLDIKLPPSMQEAVE